MANSPLHPLVDYLRRLSGGKSGDTALDDALLLHRFSTQRDDSAFTALVQRYGAMVWGLCVRRLGETPEAEDAFQATFLVLVRKAASLREPHLLGPWLYGVAFRTAMKLRGQRTRRAARESPLPEQLAEERVEPVWSELKPILDEEINRLPTKYRLPVLLCYLQGLSSEEAARRLECAKGTIFSRLSRARALLRRRLLRRGLDLSAGTLAVFLTENAALKAMVPLALREITVRTSLLFAAGTAGQVLSAPLAALVEGVVRSMFLSKVKFVAFVVLALGIVGSGVGIVGHRTDAEQPRQKPAAKSAATAPPGIVGKKKAEPAFQQVHQPPPAVVEEKQRLRHWRDTLALSVKYEGIDDPKCTLNDALELLTGRYGITFEINERAFQYDGVMDAGRTEITSSNLIRPMKASLATVLKTILARIPATSRAMYVLRKDHVEITTTMFFKAELGSKETDPVAEEMVIPLELALVWDAFEDTPVSRVLQRIADANDFNVVMDPRVAKRLQTKATAQFNNVPVDTAVRLLANMADVSMVRLDNVLYLTTEENAKHLREEQEKLNFEKTMAGPAAPPKPASDKSAK